MTYASFFSVYYAYDRKKGVVMKAVWHGTISFGLVSIPINLFSAINPHTYDFEMLHAECHHKISYQYWCDHCDKKVAWQSIVKGLKKQNGTYFIITKAKMLQLKPGKTDSINIVEFVETSQISPLYLQSHYYLAPQKSGDKAFFLFKQALVESNKAAIGQFVMRNKEYICAITPYKDAFLLNTLNYEYEIRDMKAIVALEKKPKISTEEVTLAKKLIAQLTKKTFVLSQFKDTFIQRLKKAAAQAKTTKKTPAKKSSPIKPVKEKNTLVSMLKKSLEKKKVEKNKPTGPTVHAKKKR